MAACGARDEGVCRDPAAPASLRPRRAAPNVARPALPLNDRIACRPDSAIGILYPYQ